MNERIMVLSFMSDFINGKIARRFHMITEFGKLPDSVADKLTQTAMAVSFAFCYPAMIIPGIILVCKEISMDIVMQSKLPCRNRNFFLPDT